MRLENKVAIITGGAKGLGGEMAQTFAREGAKVIAVDMMPLTYENENVEYYQLNVTDGEALSIPSLSGMCKFASPWNSILYIWHVLGGDVPASRGTHLGPGWH